MYLNLMFINPRPPVGAGARRPLYTAVVDPPPPLQKILDPRLRRYNSSQESAKTFIRQYCK